MYIGLDIDGTVVEHDYPRMGEPVPHAIRVLKRIQKKKHKIIVHTMRAEKELQTAVDYLKSEGIQVWAQNTNPSQWSWTKSNKVFCHQYIDDAATGCPLIYPEDKTKRPYVDWLKIEAELELKGIL